MNNILCHTKLFSWSSEDRHCLMYRIFVLVQEKSFNAKEKLMKWNKSSNFSFEHYQAVQSVVSLYSYKSQSTICTFLIWIGLTNKNVLNYFISVVSLLIFQIKNNPKVFDSFPILPSKKTGHLIKWKNFFPM